MIYLLRFLSLILGVTVALLKVVASFMLLAMVAVQFVAGLILCPICVVLQAIELVIVPMVYFIITGKWYYKKYQPIIDIYGDLILTGKLQFKKPESVLEWHEDFYGHLFYIIWMEIPSGLEMIGLLMNYFEKRYNFKNNYDLFK